MKRIIKINILILVSILFLTACGTKSVKREDGNLKIVTTIFPQYDFVREIAGDKVDIKMLIAPGSETHSYEPSPQDIIDIENSDLFIYVGGESDAWIDKILKDMDKDPNEVISMMDIVEVFEEELVEGMEDIEDNHKHSHSEEEYDEHVWTSPKNAMVISKFIGSKLGEIDLENQEFYRETTQLYLDKLEKLDEEFRIISENGSKKPLIFADRFPFLYLAKEYDLKYYGAFPGCSSETEASPATLKFLIDKVKEESIPVVFYIEFSNEKMADIIVESTQAKKLLLHSAHNVSKDEFKQGIGYLDIMEANLKNLKEALK